MQAAKAAVTYKVDHFDVSLTAFNEHKLNLTITDPLERLEFQGKEITLQNIGTSTLMKAFEKSKLQIKLGMNVVKGAQDTVLEIEVLISSQFLKPVCEIFSLKKKRSISQAQILTKSVEYLGKKMKQIKEKDALTPNSLYACRPVQERTFNSGVTYDEIGSVNLKKGRYLLTMTFLLKATSQGQTLLQNAGFYVPSTTYFMPHTIRKVHSVNNDNEKVSITSYYGQSYPVVIKNFILTAKKLD